LPPRGTRANAREIARGLKWLSDNFAETAMQTQANRALRAIEAGSGGTQVGRATFRRRTAAG
jgi:hypothetical protein